MSSLDGSNLTDSFNSAAGTYEKRMGTATRSVARHIIQSLKFPPHATVCDNACGTGAVTECVLEITGDSYVTAVDNSPGMIQILSDISAEKGWSQRLKLDVADGVKLPYPDDTFDIHIMAFGIFFTSDPAQAAREISRTLKPGGKAVVTSWKDSDFFRMVFDVQEIVRPAKPLHSLPMIETWRKKETMIDTMTAGGFSDVNMEVYPVNLTGPTLDDLVVSCAENFRGIIGDQWTSEEKEKIDAAFKEVLCSVDKAYLSINTPTCKGVKWTAWIATATK